MDHGASTKKTLLSRIRDPEDHDAWRAFDERYRDLIQRYARRRGLQVADAEDVRQLVLMRLSKSLSTFQYQPELGRFRDYLGVTVRRAVGELESRRRGRLEVALGEGESGQGQADSLWEHEWMQHHFRRAMQRARRGFDQRTVEVFEALLDGAAPDAVARTFGIKTQAVYKIKQRVRDALRTLVAEQIDEERIAGSA